MLDHHRDDVAGETSAVKSKIQPMKPSGQDIVTHEACGHCPYRDWFRACVGGAGRSDAHKRQREEQSGLLVATMVCGFFTDGQEPTPIGNIDITHGATPLLVVKVMPSMMIWSMHVQCKGMEDLGAIKETVESLNRLGYLEFTVRSDTEASPLADMVENDIKQGKEKVRTLVTASDT